MGVLQRFERRLGGLVEGAFARVFKGQVEPVEVAAALQREANDKKAIVGSGRVLVPNEYVVELGPTDADRLMPYEGPLTAELAAMVREHADEQGWSFVGPVRVRLEEVDRLETGMFDVRSAVVPTEEGALPTDASDATQFAPVVGGRAPRLRISEAAGERTVDIVRPVTVLGRATDADIRLADTGVSRRHAELRREGGGVVIIDLGSTNGTRVNSRPVDRIELRDGDRIDLGPVHIEFLHEGGE